jgi:hypothetical protein
MTVSCKFRDAHDDVSSVLSRALGLTNALYFVMIETGITSEMTDNARALCSLVSTLEDVLRDAEKKHEETWDLAIGEAE